MGYFNEKNIKKIVFASSIILVGILTFVFGALFITDKYLELEADLPKIEEEFVNQQKKNLHYAVNLQVDQINFRKKQIQNSLESNLRSRVTEAKAIADNLLLTNKDKSLAERTNLIRQAIRPIRFNQFRGYYFIFDMHGKIILYPPNHTFEGYSIDQVFQGDRRKAIKDLTQLIKEKHQGFLEYSWPIPGGDPNKLFTKLSFVEQLDQTDWFIGAGEYYQDFGDMTQGEILDDIEALMGENPRNYYFIYQIHNLNGGNDFATMLVNPNRPDLVGTTLSDDYQDAHGKEFRKQFLEDLREKGESFVTYYYKKSGHSEPKQKLSYFKHYPEWNWVVAKGVYLDDLETIIDEKKNNLQIKVKNKLLIFSCLLLGAVVIVVIIAHYFTRGINSIFVEYKNIQEKQHRELESINEYLHKRATIDTLTELFNRQHFNEQLSQSTFRAIRYNFKLSLILLDIDHFKVINDSYGHLAGDSVLKEISTLLQSQTRKSDLLARWGGEEFVILVLEADLETTGKIAQKLCDAVASFKFSIKQQVTCSFGITSYNYDEPITDFINRADQALYKAKENGRNQVVAG